MFNRIVIAGVAILAIAALAKSNIETRATLNMVREAQAQVITTAAPTVVTSTFANLGTPANGTIRFCSNCDPLVVLTCTSALGKTGALAIRINGAWICVGA